MIKIQEEWRHYKDKYSVSNLGRIKNEQTGRILKNKIKTNGYRTRVNQSPREQINLSINGKQETHFVHRLVAEVWIPNPKNLPQVNHIDGDSLNNKVNNLEWCSQSDNIKHAYRLKLIH